MNVKSHIFATAEQADLFAMIDSANQEDRILEGDQAVLEINEARDETARLEKEFSELEKETDEFKRRLYDLMEGKRGHLCLSIDEMFDHYLDEVTELRGLF